HPGRSAIPRNASSSASASSLPTLGATFVGRSAATRPHLGLRDETPQPSGGMAMKISLKKMWALALAAVTTGALGCSSESGSTGPSSSSAGEPQEGTAQMEIRIGRTTQINTVNFTLTGPNGFSRSGSINVSHNREAEGSIPDVPVGSPYTLNVS